MEGVERATSAAKACPGGIWTAHVAPNSRMRRIASYHCTGRATAWARSSRTAESARTRRPPGYWSGRPPAGVGAEGRPSVRPSARQWVSAAGSGRQPLRRGAPIDGRRLGTRCGRTRRGCGTRSLPVSGCRLPAPRGHPGAAAPQTSLSRAPSITLPWCPHSFEACSCHSRQKAVSQLSPSVAFHRAFVATDGAHWHCPPADIGRCASCYTPPSPRDVWSSRLPRPGCGVLARYRGQRGARVCPAASARGCARTSPRCARR